jgi:phosphatidate cytidylyltransferase
MLADRLKVAIILIILGVGLVAAGGWVFTGAIAFLLCAASWEYWRMFNSGKVYPIIWILIPGTALIVVARYLFGFNYSDVILAGLLMVSMAVHTFLSENGSSSPATDFGATIGGLLYLGFLGSYLISLRFMPGGLWWLMLAIPAISIGDAGAYFIGRKFGKHKLAPKVSPSKTIEGYFGGVLFTILGGALLGFLWSLRLTEITPLRGMILGIILGILTPLGDLGESMLKRQFGIKDTGRIFPGHGGIMDRMDSWLWGAAISYYIITWLYL